MLFCLDVLRWLKAKRFCHFMETLLFLFFPWFCFQWRRTWWNHANTKRCRNSGKLENNYQTPSHVKQRNTENKFRMGMFRNKALLRFAWDHFFEPFVGLCFFGCRCFIFELFLQGGWLFFWGASLGLFFKTWVCRFIDSSIGGLFDWQCHFILIFLVRS